VVLGGWRVSSFLTIMSGLSALLHLQFGLAAGAGHTQTPNLVAPYIFFTASASAIRGSPRRASLLHRYCLRQCGAKLSGGPNFFNLDASLAKSFRFTERLNLELRLDGFGVTNTPQSFSPPAMARRPAVTLGSSSFGQITQATGGRNWNSARS